MSNPRTLKRREFLYVSAVAAGGTMLAACGGGPATPPAAGAPTFPPPDATAVSEPTAGPQPTQASEVRQATPVTGATEYAESPALAALVEQGELPPLAERLPTKPYVVPHDWVKPGTYGGRMRMACNDIWGTAHFMQESMYGNSLLRYLRDALEIGPGLAESWESNENATEWTFNLREGLRWSDGEPFTTADIMYWWEDMVRNEEHPESPPDDVRSGTGSIATIRAVDDLTFTMTFDAPAPITPERLAAWVNRGIGPQWIVPKHYMQQFHPRYNAKLEGKEDWVEQHDQKLDWATNPENPTMSGWRLKSYTEGRSSVWERNPYYWCVTKNGDQLPYIDEITYAYVQNPEVLKLQFTNGAVDYVHGGHQPIDPSDYGQLKREEARSGLNLLLWDSGSGTGSICFFNYDHEDPKLRVLFREPKFRQALSYAYNREDVRRAVYLNTGEATTGTLSPKGFNFNVNAEGKRRYEEWRDSYNTYDPERAKRMLDELGLEPGGDGMRTLPDGGRLRITLDYGAPGAREHVRKNQLLARDWKAVGIDARLNPVPAEGFADRWQSGKLMTTTAWEVGDNMPLIYPGWVVPVSPEHWAPLHGRMFTLRGTPAETQQEDVDPWKRTPPRVAPEPGGTVDRLWKLYDRARVEVDALRRTRLEWDIFKIHVEEGPFLMGVVANWPRVTLAHKDLRNVPRREELPQGGWVNTWVHPTPAAYDPEAYYWENPDAHAGDA